jgi:hypothetical protein
MFIIKHNDEMKARDLAVRMLCTAQDILNPSAEHNLAANLLPHVSLASENIRRTFNHGNSKVEIPIRQPRSSLFAKVYTTLL